MFVRRLALALSLALMPLCADAGTRIEPPRIWLNAAQTSTALVVANERGVPAGYDIEAFEWQQQPDGQVVLAPTSAVTVEPTALDVAANGQAELRVTALQPPPKDGEAEKLYRIRIRERPDRPRDENEEHTQVIAVVTLPVFQPPPHPVKAASIEAKPLAEGGKLDFAVVNTGNVHTYVREVTVTGRTKSGRTVFSISRNGWYVLPQGRLEFTSVIGRRDCRASDTVTITAQPLDDGEPWTAMVQPRAGGCGWHAASAFPMAGQVQMTGKRLVGPPLGK